jgi:hypothetical protein
MYHIHAILFEAEQTVTEMCETGWISLGDYCIPTTLFGLFFVIIGWGAGWFSRMYAVDRRTKLDKENEIKEYQRGSIEAVLNVSDQLTRIFFIDMALIYQYTHKILTKSDFLKGYPVFSKMKDGASPIPPHLRLYLPEHTIKYKLILDRFDWLGDETLQTDLSNDQEKLDLFEKLLENYHAIRKFRDGLIEAHKATSE